MKRFSVLVIIVCIGTSLIAEDNFARSDLITFKLARISLSENGLDKADRIFHPKETVWINLKVHGLQKDSSKRVSFQADLLLVDLGQRVVLDKKNILNQSLYAGDIVPVIRATFNIDLYENIKRERYNVQITFRDMVAKRYNRYTTWFKVQ
jgi:hypothetical protein